ncbi:MAG: magnesium-translocating P-type ATPase [Actinomycetota bacterium]
MSSRISEFAKKSIAEVFGDVQSSEKGLSENEAQARLKVNGPNALKSKSLTWWSIFQRQLKNPILVLLTVTVVVSAFLGESVNSIVILIILGLSVGLGFFSEYRAEKTAQLLHARISHRANVLRDGTFKLVDVRDLVLGDVVQLSPGAVVPADLRLLKTEFLECDEGIITGESLPVAKSHDSKIDRGQELTNCALMGTIVHSGTAIGMVVAAGSSTVFGGIESLLNARPNETEFQKGLRKFSGFLLWTALALTSFIFLANLILNRPILESLLFSLAIAIGMTPQLLPAVVSIGLARGSKRLVEKNVLVKRLISIEDLGDINLLLTDKTGTLTEGTVALSGIEDLTGRTKLFGALATDIDYIYAISSQSTLNAIDAALWRDLGELGEKVIQHKKISTLAFDSLRRRTSCVVEDQLGNRFLVTKGAPEDVLSLTGTAASSTKLDDYFSQGMRVIAVASKKVGPNDQQIEGLESELEFDGFLLFSDPIKEDAAAAIRTLNSLGVEVKIATGDNALVARRVCEQVGISISAIVTGIELEGVSQAEFVNRCNQAQVFARVSPQQKAEIVNALRKDGSSVGFMGDGINDAVALHAADVGISVDTATDVAKDAADIVLLEKDLAVLADAIYQGRRVFANTMKYVLMSTSGDFGNMFSAAIGSVMLNFMPMLASQVLLNDLMYDSSQLALPTDRVDEEVLRRPSQWNIKNIRRFMLLFGPASSIFDFATFALMLWVFHAGESEFQTGWFIESLATEILIVFVVRTRLVPFYRSKPSVPLVATVFGILAVGIYLPYSPLAMDLGFVALPAPFFLALVVVVILYLVLVETLKHRFYRAIPVSSSTTTKDRTSRRLRRSIGFRVHQ